MLNDTTKEYNGETHIRNVVCNTLRLAGSWNLVTLNSRGEGVVREEKSKQNIREVFLKESCPIGCPLKFEMQDFKNFQMPLWDI